MQKKWADLKSRIKNKDSKRKKEAFHKTGGGESPPDLTEIELKVLEVIGVVAIDGDRWWYQHQPTKHCKRGD